jgi:hypothetical protein
VLHVAVVEEVTTEESDRVVGLVFVGLRESLREDEGDFVLLEVLDLGVLLAEEGF